MKLFNTAVIIVQVSLTKLIQPVAGSVIRLQSVHDTLQCKSLAVAYFEGIYSKFVKLVI